MAKLITCSRCKGTGRVNSPVVHGGIPGGCYKCDLHGKVISLTKAERAEAAADSIKSWQDEILKRVEDAKAAATHTWEERCRRRAKKGLGYKTLEEYLATDRWLQTQLAGLRDAWRSSKTPAKIPAQVSIYSPLGRKYQVVA